LITRRLVDRLFTASTTLRWGDQRSPFSLTASGYFGQVMTVAWMIQKRRQAAEEAVDWNRLLEIVVFRTFRRCVLSDIKPQVLSDLMADVKSRAAINNHLAHELREDFSAFDPAFTDRMIEYLHSDPPDSEEENVLDAARRFVRWWEFQLLKPFNPHDLVEEGLEDRIKNALADSSEYLVALTGDSDDSREARRFVEMCGTLRFQDRWGQTPIIPRRPILDHEYLVAVLAYLCSVETGAGPICSYNNFFGALFHDFGEVLTRDIISPIKTIASDVGGVIKDFEERQLRKTVIAGLPEVYRGDFEYWIIGEFDDKRRVNGELARVDGCQPRTTLDETQQRYDGSMIKGCDSFCAYMEAYYSARYGVFSLDLARAIRRLYERRKESEPHGADFEVIYELCYHDIEEEVRRVLAMS
jgi:putative hydrolases of HD superfamily